MDQNRSYADAARSRSPPLSEYFPGALPYGVPRRNSANSNTSPLRNSMIATPDIPDPIPESTTAPSQPFHHGSLNINPENLRRPSLASTEPRRPSIAQVLGRIGSRSSYLSDSPSRSSLVPIEQPAIPVYDDPVPSKGPKRKRKPKNRRRKSSQTADHGDFIASRGRPTEMRPISTALKSPLLTAISEGNIKLVRMLVADETNLRGDDDPNYRPLQVAALGGHLEIVKILLDTGKFDINARDSRERTALYAAASRGNQSIMSLLRSRKAKELSSEESRIANLEWNRWRQYEGQIDAHESSLQQEQTIEGANMTAEPVSDNDLPSISVRTSSRGGDSNDGDHIYKLEVGSCENIREMEEVANQRRQFAQERGEWVKGPLKSPQL